jgi:hypothetical protein
VSFCGQVRKLSVPDGDDHAGSSDTSGLFRRDFAAQRYNLDATVPIAPDSVVASPDAWPSARERMTPEECERFRQRVRERCGFEVSTSENKRQ